MRAHDESIGEEVDGRSQRLLLLHWRVDHATKFRTALLFVASIVASSACAHAAEDSLIESIDVSTLPPATDKQTFWMHARPGTIPSDDAAGPKIVVTLQKTDRVGTHMYHGLAAIWSSDLGKTWTALEEIKSVDRFTRPDGMLDAVCDMTPQWHEKTSKLLVTGATFLQDLKTHHNLPRGPSETPYAVYDPATSRWSERQSLKMPDDRKFYFARAGCTQRIDLPDGDILLPIYFYSKGAEEINYVTVVRCGFDGTTLTYKSHGSELTVDLGAKRDRTGLYEPSLAYFKGKYFLTMRADEGAYVSTSDDGLHYSEPMPWTFDNGEKLGSYNTQQHWVTHSDGLYLCYTRKGAHNDEILRHRAPLFMARVDPDQLVVEHVTEKIVLPNLGKPFGNFGVCNVSANETWVVDCLVDATPGAANVYLARIRWSQANKLLGH